MGVTTQTRLAGLDLSGVSVSIDGRPVLRDIRASAPGGLVTGVLGPNGAGKSTLLRVIGGIMAPDAGTVAIDGTDLAALPRRERARRIALLEQNATPSTDLTAREVVQLGRIPHRRGLLSPTDSPSVDAALEAAGVTDIADRHWHTLSGGQQQRVQVARALAQEPGVLLLDEPTNHLDVHAQLSLLRQVRGLGVTAVMALHDLTLAAAHCDRILLLDDGCLVAAGTPAEVLQPATISTVYGVDCDVLTNPRTGHPVIVFS
ncbi:ABC transporter ATP-binding protein [Salinibacterium sp. dk2585]|uniref:ABC transporter ATP-binding protein n=1 Tax=unclassified Salinibacterium TaxID=2632331 RepID=UPI0011C24AED|nr:MULTISPECIES: ABC transporter ATP-binding protein [unclassified Salinibacterium]QEE60319.1 ABC transporter ATP-binding protein [Salinibacterium sp. dk2585]TXK55391.1 ABC transporter ATP-binding protein [Salinibacterium sp. dk5596]